MSFREPTTATIIWAILALAAITFGFWFLVHQLAYEWLPTEVVGYIAVGMFCFGAGIIIGSNSTRKALKKDRSSGPPASTE